MISFAAYSISAKADGKRESKMASYSIDQLSRREILRMSAVLTSSAIVWSTGFYARVSDVAETRGPNPWPFLSPQQKAANRRSDEFAGSEWSRSRAGPQRDGASA